MQWVKTGESRKKKPRFKLVTYWIFKLIYIEHFLHFKWKKLPFSSSIPPLFPTRASFNYRGESLSPLVPISPPILFSPSPNHSLQPQAFSLIFKIMSIVDLQYLSPLSWSPNFQIASGINFRTNVSWIYSFIRSPLYISPSYPHRYTYI